MIPTCLERGESTLFRKIKELNKLLLEFDIQIKNNKLIGEESQIRYFYYLLFDSLHPKFRPDLLQVTKFQVEFVRQLEETLKVNFSESSKDKLYRWLAITERRRKLTDIQITNSNKSLLSSLILRNKVDSLSSKSSANSKIM